MDVNYHLNLIGIIRGKMKTRLQYPLYLVVLSSSLMSVSANAIPPVQAVDVKSFDVGGVKTGMSIEEAQAAMQKNFGIKPAQIRASKSMKSQTPSIITGSQQIMHLVYEDKGTRMQVNFEPRVPYNKSNPMAVSQVLYEIPWTKENENNMVEAALKKYGSVSTGGVFPVWCEKPMPTSGMGCESGTASLSMGNTKIQLIDPAWQNAVINYMAQQKKTKPML